MRKSNLEVELGTHFTVASRKVGLTIFFPQVSAAGKRPITFPIPRFTASVREQHHQRRDSEQSRLTECFSYYKSQGFIYYHTKVYMLASQSLYPRDYLTISQFASSKIRPFTPISRTLPSALRSKSKMQ